MIQLFVVMDFIVTFFLITEIFYNNFVYLYIYIYMYNNSIIIVSFLFI